MDAILSSCIHHALLTHATQGSQQLEDGQCVRATGLTAQGAAACSDRAIQTRMAAVLLRQRPLSPWSCPQASANAPASPASRGPAAAGRRAARPPRCHTHRACLSRHEWPSAAAAMAASLHLPQSSTSSHGATVARLLEEFGPALARPLNCCCSHQPAGSCRAVHDLPSEQGMRRSPQSRVHV